ncbi:MAG: hypothetical protein HY812_00310 [Planctomycetes bacterium]|nr:hypothetical protein [Planctomycetota bacterium]
MWLLPAIVLICAPALAITDSPPRAEEFRAGHVLVADRGADVIQEYDEGGELVRTLGEGQAGLSEPWGLAFGLDGRLVVVASGSGDIFRISGDGAIERQANPGSLVSPRGVTVGASGRLIVASHGNDSVVVLGLDGSTESVIPCPPGLGGPIGVALDPAGRVWVASEEASTVYGMDDAGEVVGGPLPVSGPASDLLFLGDWIVLVTVPSTDELRAWNAYAETGGALVDYFPSPEGQCLASDGSYLLALGGSGGVVRFPWGPFGMIQFGEGTLTDPGDVVTVPWRYSVRLRGRGYSSDAEEPHGRLGTKVLEQAVLSLYPGTYQLLVEFDAGGMIGSAGWLDQRGIVLQGGGQLSYWSVNGPGQEAVMGTYREARLHPEEIEASVVIHHTRPPSKWNFYYSTVDDLGGRMIVSRLNGSREVMITARLLDAKLLNKP